MAQALAPARYPGKGSSSSWCRTEEAADSVEVEGAVDRARRREKPATEAGTAAGMAVGAQGSLTEGRAAATGEGKGSLMIPGSR